MDEFLTPKLKAGAALLILIFVIYLVVVAEAVLTPFLIAFGLAYLFDPLIDFFEKRGMGRSVAIVILLVSFFCGITLLSALIWPVAQSQIAALAENLPHYAAALKNWAEPLFATIPQVDAADVSRQFEKGLAALGDLPLQAIENIGAALASGFSSAVRLLMALVNLFIIPVATFYLLKDFDTITATIEAQIPPRHRHRVVTLVKKADTVLSRFVRGQLIVASLMGFFLALGLTLIGTPLGLLIGLIAGVANVVPYLAVVVGLLPALLLTALQYGDWLHPALVLGLFGVAQLLESFIISPKVLEEAVGLHPVSIIAALLFGGQFFGLVGLLLAVPVAAVLKVLLEEVLCSYRQSPFFGAEPRQNDADDSSTTADED